MERVGIFHNELPRAHHTKTGADFVAEFGLNLIKISRQLLVTANLLTHQVGDDLLMGRAQYKASLVTIFKAQQLRSISFPALRLLPELCGLYHRHQDFLCTCGIHFFSDNMLHFAQYAQPQRQPGVKT